MTVLELLAELKAAGCPPVVEDFDLAFGMDLPGEFLPLVELLQSGLRAHLTGRKWFGIDTRGKGAARPDGELSFAELLPAGTVLLTVEGDESWDRIAWHCSRELPTARAFATETATNRKGPA